MGSGSTVESSNNGARSMSEGKFTWAVLTPAIASDAMSQWLRGRPLPNRPTFANTESNHTPDGLTNNPEALTKDVERIIQAIDKADSKVVTLDSCTSLRISPPSE